MNTIIKKWKNLLIVPFLCVTLALMTGCGGNSLEETELTELPVIEESQNEGGSAGEQDTGTMDSSPGGDNSLSGDNLSPEGNYNSSSGDNLSPEGNYNSSSGDDSSPEGNYNSSSGDNSVSQGEDESGGDKDQYTSDADYYQEGTGGGDDRKISEDGVYTTKEDVALYIHTYRKLPRNFMTKKEARALGWSGGSLEQYAPGMCIGGDRFRNAEGYLPQGKYQECDINTLGKERRGAERLIFSDDGRIYYTSDHYETFTQLYDGY